MMVNGMGGKVFFLQTLCAILLHSLMPFTVQAENKLSTADMYGGVVVNQTITMIGQEFYQEFMALWREKEQIERFVLSIHERASARQGSQIWVTFGEKRVFQAQLPSARSRVRDLGQQAVEIAYQQIIDAELQTLLFRDADLGTSEL